MNTAAAPRRRPASGLTLMELLVAMGVIAILLAIAVPQFTDWMNKQRVISIASALATDAQYARSETIQRTRNVRIMFKSSGTGSCYTVHTAGSGAGRCDCTWGAGSACVAPYVELKTVSIPAADGVSLSVLPTRLEYAPPNAEPVQSSFSIDVTGAPGRQLTVRTNATGRPQICQPAGSNIGGFAPC